MRSPLLLYGKNADADIDISNFAEQDIREMREVYGPKKGFSDDVGYIAMIYGKKSKTMVIRYIFRTESA